MNTLSSDQMAQLLKSLLRAFPKISNLEQMVRLELGEHLNNVAGGETLNDVTFNLIKWAESQGRLNNLIDGAYNANSGSPELSEFYEAWQASFPDDAVPEVTKKSNILRTSEASQRSSVTQSQTNPKTQEIITDRTFVDGNISADNDLIGRDQVGRDQIKAETVNIYETSAANWLKFAALGCVIVAFSVLAFIFYRPSSTTNEAEIDEQSAGLTVVPTATLAQVAAPPPKPTIASTRICDDSRQCILVAEFHPSDNDLSMDIVGKIRAELTNDALMSTGRFDVQVIDAIQDVDEVRNLAQHENAQIIVWGQVLERIPELNINFELTNQLGINQSNQVRPYRTQFFGSTGQSLECGKECYENADFGEILDQLGEIIAHTAAGMLHYGLDQPEEADHDFGVALYCAGEEIESESLHLTNVDCAPDQTIEGFNTGSLYYYAGRSKILTGDYSRAASYLEEASKQNPDDPAPYIGIATAYRSWIDQDDNPLFDEALESAKLRSNQLRNAPAIRNASPQKMAAVDYELGFIAELQKDWATAEEKYTKAIEGFGTENKEAYVTYIALGRVQHRAGKVEEANETLNRAYNLDSSAPWALIELALLHQGDRDRAESYLKDAREIAPFQAYVDIVEAQLCAGWTDYDCAEEAYRRALEKRPNSGWLYGRIGNFYDYSFGTQPLLHQSWETAASNYEKAVKRRPNDPWAHERLAFAYLYQNNLAEAVEHFDLSLNQLSHSQSHLAGRYCNLAQVQHALQMLDDALANYQICLDKGLEDSETRSIVESIVEKIQEQLGSGSE